MDQVPASAAGHVATFLLDERDQASLRCTCTFWNSIFTDNPGLWNELIQQRFGPVTNVAAPAPAEGPAGAGSTGPAGPGSTSTASASSAATAADRPAETPEQQFRQLAMLAKQQPVASLERLVWLDGHHLKRIQELSSTFGPVIAVQAVCWLEMAGWFRGVMPGRYRVGWRMRVEDHFHFDEGRLVVRQQPGEGLAAAAEQNGAAEELPSSQPEDNWLSATQIDRGLLESNLQQVGRRWFEVTSAPFGVSQLSDLAIKLEATSGAWKYGLAFDCVQLQRIDEIVPEPPPLSEGAAERSLAGVAGRLLGEVRHVLGY